MRAFKLFFTLWLWFILFFIFIPSCGERFDKLCIKGKSRYRQELFVKGKNPVIIDVDEDDRIIRKECSEFLRQYTFRNEYEAMKDWLKHHRFSY